MQGLLDGSRIAVFHDDLGALAAPTAATTVAVYVRDEQNWNEDTRHGFRLAQGAGLAELREQMQGLAKGIVECKDRRSGEKGELPADAMAEAFAAWAAKVRVGWAQQQG